MRLLTRFTATVSAGMVLLVAVPVHAGFIVDVEIYDPLNAYVAYHSKIVSHTKASGEMWGAHFPGTTTVEVRITFPDGENAFTRATGRSTVSQWMTDRNGFHVAEQGLGRKIRDGFDANGADHDVEFTFHPNYLQNVIWFDPDPYSRTTPMPSNKTDAMSVFLHEFGHAIAFNGWQHHTDGSYVNNWRSTYDELKTFDGTNYWFNGPQATSLYGGPVPVTYDNVNHIGNGIETSRPGSDIVPDLMNGVVFYNGQRYFISPLDLAITADTGLPVISTPEPSTITLFLLAGLAYGCGRRAKSWVRNRLKTIALDRAA